MIIGIICTLGLVYCGIASIMNSVISQKMDKWINIIYRSRINMLNLDCKKYDTFNEKYNYSQQYNLTIRSYISWVFNPINWFKSPILDKKLYAITMYWYKKEVK